jgi:hypothetical protein
MGVQRETPLRASTPSALYYSTPDTDLTVRYSGPDSGTIRQVVQKPHQPHAAFGHCGKPQGGLQYFELINPLEITHMNIIFNVLSMRLSNQIRRIQSFAIELPH